MSRSKFPLLDCITVQKIFIYIYFINITIFNSAVKSINLFEINKNENPISYFDMLSYKQQNSKENGYDMKFLNTNDINDNKCKSKYVSNLY